MKKKVELYDYIYKGSLAQIYGLVEVTINGRRAKLPRVCEAVHVQVAAGFCEVRELILEGPSDYDYDIIDPLAKLVLQGGESFTLPPPTVGHDPDPPGHYRNGIPVGGPECQLSMRGAYHRTFTSE